MAFCDVYDCKNRLTRNASIRIFRVPPGMHPYLANKRHLWQEAIREANGSKQQTPLTNPRVCEAHFISGEASSDFDSPDFVPSVFPRTEKSKTDTQESALSLNNPKKKKKNVCEINLKQMIRRIKLGVVIAI
uniref:THAP-type domain-containing protein n=1 Tax=Salarias fasciatus TaxID=181472 RepID=A0A672JEZ3_SALFA